MINQTIYVVQNDYGYQIQLNLFNADGSVFNLTGESSLTFQGQFAQTSGNKFSNAASVSGSPSAGVITYTVEATDFTQVGTYRCALVVAFATSVVTFNDIIVIVQPVLPTF